MSRAVALVLVVVAVLWTRYLGLSTTAASAGAALVLGFVLIGAWLMGDALRWLRLPRLTGYLIFGAVIGPYAGNLITGLMAGQLQVVTGIATTLIALIAGLTLSVERLGPRLGPIARLTAVAVAVPLSIVLVGSWLAWPAASTQTGRSARTRRRSSSPARSATRSTTSTARSSSTGSRP